MRASERPSYRPRRHIQAMPIGILTELQTSFRNRAVTIEIACCVCCGKPIAPRSYVVVSRSSEAVAHLVCEEPEA